MKNPQSDETGLNALINASLEIRKEGLKKRKGGRRGRLEEEEGWKKRKVGRKGRVEEKVGWKKRKGGRRGRMEGWKKRKDGLKFGNIDMIIKRT